MARAKRLSGSATRERILPRALGRRSTSPIRKFSGAGSSPLQCGISTSCRKWVRSGKAQN